MPSAIVFLRPLGLRLVARTHPGTTVPVKILRDGQTKSLSVTLNQLPGEEKLASAHSRDNGDSGTLNGVGVGDLDAKARRESNAPASLKGVVVTEVAPDSAAAEAGLRPGDIIQEINRHPVRSADEAVRLTENPADKTTLLRVWREGGSRYVVVDESKAG